VTAVVVPYEPPLTLLAAIMLSGMAGWLLALYGYSDGATVAIVVCLWGTAVSDVCARGGDRARREAHGRA
jgi:hypothetical protein